ncbi:MAG: peptidylprolyl isomerase [Bryobacteraceae bacterium]|nr:peptidylprolyl isomerase [Bryobacteraceae bacterium]
MPWMVNGELVDEDAVRAEAQMMRQAHRESVPDMDPIEAEMQLKEWARENVIERMLLRQAGQETVPPFKPPVEKDIAAFYAKNKQKFYAPELCWAKHIIRNVEPEAGEEKALEQIKLSQEALAQGESFESVADRFSDCPGNGGNLNWFPRGEMVEEFDAEVFDLPVGQTTGIFRTVFGFHIARVYGRKPAGIRPLSDVRQQIVEALTAERAQQALEDYIDALRAKADIKQVRSAT